MDEGIVMATNNRVERTDVSEINGSQTNNEDEKQGKVRWKKNRESKKRNQNRMKFCRSDKSKKRRNENRMKSHRRSDESKKRRNGSETDGTDSYIMEEDGRETDETNEEAEVTAIGRNATCRKNRESKRMRQNQMKSFLHVHANECSKR